MKMIQERYKEILPELMETTGRKNMNAVPRIEKVVINAGLGKSIQDPTYVDSAVSVIARISGQQPIKTKAKKSISNFKIRKGMIVGAKVTLRGKRMYDFLNKMITIALPRVRDFQGIERNGFDGRGNYSLGFPEHIVFPEISTDEIEKIVGLEINVVTSARTDAEGRMLLEKLGFPFKKVDQK